VVKSDGELTYFASDIAYHCHKLERGFRRLINVWGADHHGYVGRLKAGLQALGYDAEALRVVLVQLVQLTRGGEPVRMGKRLGEFVSLQEVLEEVGKDAARFFFLMRKAESHLDFDLELAKRESAENPVFYVQYAHARIAGIFEQARQLGIPTEWGPAAVETGRLAEREELNLIKRVVECQGAGAASAGFLPPRAGGGLSPLLQPLPGHLGRRGFDPRAPFARAQRAEGVASGAGTPRGRRAAQDGGPGGPGTGKLDKLDKKESW
jgi:arginyl-tRNA synthetase